ncbi:Uncharacterized protein cmbei_4003820 [Cryptosporidium meleagridis]
MIGGSKIDNELVSKEQLIIVSEYFDVIENSKQAQVKTEIEDEFHSELIYHKLKNNSENIIHNLDQIQEFSPHNMEQASSKNYYLTTTASSSDQVADCCNSAFPIREFEDHKKSNPKSNSHLNETKTHENDNNLFNLKMNKFNSVIKEDKEKRKVIVEWLNNNEWSCKQWSCKKFGKEGAAKRAIQFLEKIHGATINCLPEGFYSTLLEIGSIESSKSSYSKRKTTDFSNKNLNKSSKVVQETESNKFSDPSLKFYPTQSSHEHKTVDLIQKIMLLFSSIDSDFFNQLEEYNNKHFEWEKLHSSCRKQLRNLVLEYTSNKKFAINEYDLLCSQATQMLGVNQSGSNDHNLLLRGIFDSILGVKTVKEVLNKTTRRELQHFYAIKDIIQIINMAGVEEIGIQKNKSNLNQWNKAIENASRINDDLNYLSEGGLAGHSPIACTNYGSGFFQFNCKNILNSNSKVCLNSIINHKKSCMNLLHTEIQDNGYRSVYPNDNEKRRIATRLQGRVQNLENCDYTGISSSKLLESDSNLKDNLEINQDQIETSKGGQFCMQMSNGIYTLLDIKYGIKGGRSKEILCDVLRNNKVYYNKSKENGGFDNNENLCCNRKYFCTDENQNHVSEKKTVKKRRSNNNSENANKIQKLNHENLELQKSKIEWWKKPRGWKVTYFKQGQKFSQIFRVSLNSTNLERESQYKQAYSFYLSTQEENKKGIQTNDENDNTINTLGFEVKNIHESNHIENVTKDLASSSFIYGIPNIFHGPNLIQIFNTNLNSRNITTNSNIFGNILPFNFCLPPLFGSCNNPFYGIGMNNCSNIQNDQGYNQLSMENHAGVYSSTQLPYQAYSSFIPSINPFIMPMFPSSIQNNTNLNAEWSNYTGNSKDLTSNVNIVNNTNI